MSGINRLAVIVELRNRGLCTIAVAISGLFFSLTVPAVAEAQLTDQQIAAVIVQASRDAYYRTGHPCACPDDLARNGVRCGKRSAYSRPGGAEPYCYISDVPKAEIEEFRTPH